MLKYYLSLAVLAVMLMLTPTARAESYNNPTTTRIVSENINAKVTQENTSFANGDFFWFRRYEFLRDDTAPFTSSFTIPGDTITVRALLLNGDTKTWQPNVSLEALPYTTLFIDTNEYHMVLGIPAVYAKSEDYTNLDAVVSKQLSPKIVKTEAGYTISISYPQDDDYMGEVWALQSRNVLIEWTPEMESLLLTNDFSREIRLSLEGYYLRSPNSYLPTGPNMYYRTPAAYTGGTFARLNTNLLVRDLGYVIMKTTLRNQNELGYIPTPTRSDWLYKDFGIESSFYDTRFNNDFGKNLLFAYAAYNDPAFLEAALRYGDFYLAYTAKHSHSTGKGILVSDYWHESPHTLTHASLNHHVDGITFLLQLYQASGKRAYLDTVSRMMMGLEETKTQWVRPDNNLEYALYYTGTNNLMIDYPSLTYNDLYTLRYYLKTVLNASNSTVQYLMDCKLAWMTAQGITDYSK